MRLPPLLGPTPKPQVRLPMPGQGCILPAPEQPAQVRFFPPLRVYRPRGTALWEDIHGTRTNPG